MMPLTWKQLAFDGLNESEQSTMILQVYIWDLGFDTLNRNCIDSYCSMQPMCLHVPATTKLLFQRIDVMCHIT